MSACKDTEAELPWSNLLLSHRLSLGTLCHVAHRVKESLCLLHQQITSPSSSVRRNRAAACRKSSFWRMMINKRSRMKTWCCDVCMCGPHTLWVGDAIHTFITGVYCCSADGKLLVLMQLEKKWSSGCKPYERKCFQRNRKVCPSSGKHLIPAGEDTTDQKGVSHHAALHTPSRTARTICISITI